VVADRLRKLEAWGLVERGVGGVGEPVAYRLTEAGRGLGPVFAAFRRWGVRYLVGEPGADGEEATFDVSFVANVEAIPRESYEWRIDDRVLHLEVDGGVLRRRPGPAPSPVVTLATTGDFMARWAEGELGWDEGVDQGLVAVTGTDEAWRRMLAATGYLASYGPVDPVDPVVDNRSS
jgi:hypothetical protein